MKAALRLTILTLFIFSPATASLGQQAKLEGQVFDDTGRSVSGVRVIVPGGQAVTTDSKGHFTVSFAASVTPGQAVRIQVANWKVFDPMFGECWTQSVARSKDSLKVTIISPNSAVAHVNRKRLSAIVDEFQARVNRQAKTVRSLKGSVDRLEREREKYAFLREYEEEYGVPADKLKAALDEWARMKESGDALERARQEYWLGNFDKVTELTGEAGPVAVEVLKRKHQQQLEEGRKVIGIYTLRGNAFYEQYKFREALESFSVITQLFEARDLPKEDFIAEWAETRSLIGKAKESLGERVEGEEGPRLLREALAEYQQSATFYTRGQSPRHWAAAQNSVGVVLLNLGVRGSGPDSLKYLNDSVAACRAALEVSTRERVPQDWAATQNNLGVVLLSLGERLSGVESVKYLSDADAALRATLEVFTRERLPQDWAATQNNLGVVLTNLGEQVSGVESIEYLTDAVAAYHAALEVFTRGRLPEDWAETQNNLGNALLRLGERVDASVSITYLNYAAAAYRAALEVFTRDRLPQAWATTQNNLGVVLTDLGEQVSGAQSIKYLTDAVAACRAALEVRTRKHLPQDWAAAQNNLGNALLRLGERVSGSESTRYLNDAVAAYVAALEVVTLEHSPQDWAAAQNGLARAHFQRHDWSGAAEAYTNVLMLYPNRKEAYERAAQLYHDTLFKFDKAFFLNQQWLARHPEDISAQADFAEAHFTIGRFADCGQRISALLSLPEVSVSTKTALRAIEIASLVADSKVSQVPVKLDALIAEVTRQPTEFKVTRGFDGTKHFIGQNERLSPYRAWLGQLFDALASNDRDTMLNALQDVRAKMKDQRYSR